MNRQKPIKLDKVPPQLNRTTLIIGVSAVYPCRVTPSRARNLMARNGRRTHAVCRTRHPGCQTDIPYVYLARRPDQMDTDLREPQAWRSSHLQATSTTLEYSLRLPHTFLSTSLRLTSIPTPA